MRFDFRISNQKPYRDLGRVAPRAIIAFLPAVVRPLWLVPALDYPEANMARTTAYCKSQVYFLETHTLKRSWKLPTPHRYTRPPQRSFSVSNTPGTRPWGTASRKARPGATFSPMGRQFQVSPQIAGSWTGLGGYSARRRRAAIGASVVSCPVGARRSSGAATASQAIAKRGSGALSPAGGAKRPRAESRHTSRLPRPG